MWTLDTFLLLRQTGFIVVIQLQIWCTAALGDSGDGATWNDRLSLTAHTNWSQVLISNDFTNAVPPLQRVLSFGNTIQMPLTAPATVASGGHILTPQCFLASCSSLINAVFTSFLHFSSLSRHITPLPASPYLSQPPLSCSEACFNYLLLLYVKGKWVRFSSWLQNWASCPHPLQLCDPFQIPQAQLQGIMI